MTPAPETRDSLIRRLPNAVDAEAWDMFVRIYEPLLFRLARRRGLQPADAEDFTQEALSAVARSVDRWVTAPERGTFRAWLFRIASNLAINFLTRPKHQRWGAGDSRVARLLEERDEPNDEASAVVALEHRRELFRLAAEQVRSTVAEKQWRAFWLTAVEEQPIPAVAERLAMSVGAIYIARSRIIKRLRDLLANSAEATP